MVADATGSSSTGFRVLLTVSLLSSHVFFCVHLEPLTKRTRRRAIPSPPPEYVDGYLSANSSGAMALSTLSLVTYERILQTDSPHRHALAFEQLSRRSAGDAARPDRRTGREAGAWAVGDLGDLDLSCRMYLQMQSARFLPLLPTVVLLFCT